MKIEKIQHSIEIQGKDLIINETFINERLLPFSIHSSSSNTSNKLTFWLKADINSFVLDLILDHYCK